MIPLLIFVLFVVVIATVIGGGVWFVLRSRGTVPETKAVEQSMKTRRPTFRWKYVVLPLFLFILSFLLSVYFHRQLPPEVAVHFSPGLPGKWISREAIIISFLVPQFFFALLAAAATWGMTKLGTLSGLKDNTWAKWDKLLLFMGNIFVLPQVIVCFAMFYIFGYNLLGTPVIPVCAFLFVILGLATVIIGLFLTLVVSTARR